MITNRPRRLIGVPYVGYQRYFITICTALRRPLFVSPTVVDDLLLILRNTCEMFEFAITAYCFMPDHAHALLTANSERSDLRECVRRFKQVSAFQHKRRLQQRLWQPGYHDRILRDDEGTEAVIRYVMENPIRAGLTQAIGEYPFAGSDVYDISALLTAWEGRT